MANDLVWAYKRLPELGFKLGFVECEASVAADLYASGDAQDPRVGCNTLKPMDDSPYVSPNVVAKTTKTKSKKAGDYDNKELTA